MDLMWRIQHSSLNSREARDRRMIQRIWDLANYRKEFLGQNFIKPRKSGYDAATQVSLFFSDDLLLLIPIEHPMEHSPVCILSFLLYSHVWWPAHAHRRWTHFNLHFMLPLFVSLMACSCSSLSKMIQSMSWVPSSLLLVAELLLLLLIPVSYSSICILSFLFALEKS